MASVKAILRKKNTNKSGIYPLVIRITKDRKSSFVYTGYNLRNDQWDETKSKVKKHENTSRLNNLIAKRIAEFTQELLDDEIGHKNSSPKTIKQKVVGKINGHSFMEFSWQYLNNLKDEGKFNRLSSERPVINRLTEFTKDSDFGFEDITVQFLNNFRAFLKRTRNVSERTVVNNLICIRTIYNQAIQEHIVERKHYPFGKGKVRIKIPDSVKIGLTREEVRVLEELDLSGNPSQHHARNLWLLSFYFAGMRVSDLLRLTWNDINDGRLSYKMEKNAKFGSLKITDKANKILQEYKQLKFKHQLIFPELSTVENLENKFEVQRQIAQSVSKLRRLLKRIAVKAEVSKPLSMHIARHTFGNISGDKIPIQMLQKLYRHSHITTTVNYQSNFIYEETDNALEIVVG